MPVSRKKLEPKLERPRTPAGKGNVSTTADPQMIATMAYSYWEARGYAGGSPEEDWFRAEQELSGKMAKAASNLDG